MFVNDLISYVWGKERKEMNGLLADVIKDRSFKEFRYYDNSNALEVNKDVLEIKIEDDNIKIRFCNKKTCCITIVAKADNKQNIEIYNMIKDDLIKLHKPFADFSEYIEVEADDRDIYSFFGIGVRIDVECEDMQNVEKEYMYKLLKILTDSEHLYKNITDSVENKQGFYIIKRNESTEFFS